MNQQTLLLSVGGLTLISLGVTVVTTSPRARELPQTTEETSCNERLAMPAHSPHSARWERDAATSPGLALDRARTEKPPASFAAAGVATAHSVAHPSQVPALSSHNTSAAVLEISDPDNQSVTRGPMSEDNAAFVPVDASAPGSIIHVGRHSVVVEGYEEMSGRPGPALTVITADRPDPSPTDRRAGKIGFTAEEELFRTRWGWALFEATRRTALEEESSR